jgi:hypothetical protein
VEVLRYDDPEAWLTDATPLLGADEPRHNLMFGIADRLIHDPGAYPEHRLWLATEGTEPVGALMQTPPYPVIVAEPADPGAIDALVEAALPFAGTIPGVNGARPEVDAFTEAWCARTGSQWHMGVEMGIYACDETTPVPGASGTPRLGTPDDFDAVFAMFLAFADEALQHETNRDREREERGTHDQLASEPGRAGMWLWEDEGRIVSITGHGGRTPNGIRIGPVYTPPELRGRGYATALVHHQTSWLLREHVGVCFLYTDLSNPTSNAVYRRIGYEQHAEAAEIRLDPQPQSGGSGA